MGGICLVFKGSGPRVSPATETQGTTREVDERLLRSDRGYPTIFTGLSEVGHPFPLLCPSKV